MIHIMKPPAPPAPYKIGDIIKVDSWYDDETYEVTHVGNRGVHFRRKNSSQSHHNYAYFHEVRLADPK